MNISISFQDSDYRYIPNPKTYIPNISNPKTYLPNIPNSKTYIPKAQSQTYILKLNPNLQPNNSIPNPIFHMYLYMFRYLYVYLHIVCMFLCIFTDFLHMNLIDWCVGAPERLLTIINVIWEKSRNIHKNGGKTHIVGRNDKEVSTLASELGATFTVADVLNENFSEKILLLIKFIFIN